MASRDSDTGKGGAIDGDVDWIRARGDVDGDVETSGVGDDGARAIRKSGSRDHTDRVVAEIVTDNQAAHGRSVVDDASDVVAGHVVPLDNDVGEAGVLAVEGDADAVCLRLMGLIVVGVISLNDDIGGRGIAGDGIDVNFDSGAKTVWILAVVLSGIANDLDAVGRGCDGVPDASTAGSLYIIIGNRDIATADGDAGGVDVMRRRDIANIGVDCAVIRGRKVGNTTVGSVLRGGLAVVIEKVAVDGEVVPESKIDKVERIRRRGGNEVVVNSGTGGADEAAAESNTETVDAGEDVVGNVDLAGTGSGTEEGKTLAFVSAIAKDAQVERPIQQDIGAVERNHAGEIALVEKLAVGDGPIHSEVGAAGATGNVAIGGV